MIYYNLRTVQRLLNHFLVHYLKDNQKEQQIIPIHCILKLTCHHKHMKTSKSYTQHLRFIPFLVPVFWLLKKKKYLKLGNLIKDIPLTVCVNQSGIDQTHFNLSKEQQNFFNYCFSSYCSFSLTLVLQIRGDNSAEGLALYARAFAIVKEYCGKGQHESQNKYKSLQNLQNSHSNRIWMTISN